MKGLCFEVIDFLTKSQFIIGSGDREPAGNCRHYHWQRHVTVWDNSQWFSRNFAHLPNGWWHCTERPAHQEISACDASL